MVKWHQQTHFGVWGSGWGLAWNHFCCDIFRSLLLHTFCIALTQTPISFVIYLAMNFLNISCQNFGAVIFGCSTFNKYEIHLC